VPHTVLHEFRNIQKYPTTHSQWKQPLAEVCVCLQHPKSNAVMIANDRSPV
jgi:hypothetical protein